MYRTLFILLVLLMVLAARLVWRRESWLRGVILLRVPLLTSLILLFVPPLVVWREFSMLANLFALSQDRDAFVVMLLGFLAAWLCGFTGLLIWE